MIWGLLIIAIIVLDQVTKHLIPVGIDIEIIKGFFYITYCENRELPSASSRISDGDSLSLPS